MQCYFTYILGVIPKAVMDSMEFLTNFHLLKDTKREQRKRHSLKGKKCRERTKWNCTISFVSPLKASCVLCNLIFSNTPSDAVCEDRALDAREVKGQTTSL